MRFTIFSLAALAVTASAVATQPAIASSNMPLSLVKKVDRPSLSPVRIELATNAERLAQGPAPKAPAKRSPPRDGSYPDGAIRAAAAPRAQASPSPLVQQDCNILATLRNGDSYFISPEWNSDGVYGALQANQDGSLLVSFSYSSDSSSQLLLFASNGPNSSYPYFGGIVSTLSPSDDLGRGYNYAYLGGTSQTPPGSPAVAGRNSYSDNRGIDKNIESAIWTYDPDTQSITPQWINSDGRAPNTKIYIGIFLDMLVLTGDLELFGGVFRVGYVRPLTFKCVPPKAPARL